MDRGWINADRLSDEYRKGVEDFCVHATKNAKSSMLIICPCRKCLNVKEVRGRIELREHLMFHGFDKTYKVWTYHGEKKSKRSSSEKSKYSATTQFSSQFEFSNILKTANMGVGDDTSVGLNNVTNFVNEELRDHPDMSDDLRGDVGVPLWPGCTKASKLSAVLILYNLKASHQVSDIFFTKMLEAVSELLPDGNVLPRRAYDAKQLLKSIGLTHEKIHACVDDCILFRKEYAELSECPKCGKKRYKKNNSPA